MPGIPGASARLRQLMAGLALGLMLGLGLGSTPALAAGDGLWQRPERFIDENGQAVTLGQFEGQPALVVMEYSACRFVCTVNWRKLVEVQEAADRLHRDVLVLVFSIDPEHDTPALWREYRQARSLKRSNWRFLTANRKDTDSLARWLGVQWWRYGDAIMHNFRILRLDAAGRQVRVMDTFDANAAGFLTP